MDQELNYSPYLSDVENFFIRKRNSFRGRLSCLDWVLVENWKEQGVPLEAVLKGIDRAFERKKEINSLAYCVKFVEEVCEERKELTVEAPRLPDFREDEVAEYLRKLAAEVQSIDSGIAESMRRVELTDLRTAEQTLSALEEKLIAKLKVMADDKTMIEIKQSVDRELNAFRSTMTVPQLAMVEQQMWRRKLLERFGVPRLSLFYLI
ncbi:MAG TPA: hypothetical protein VER98_03145 [Terriglobia bacterium]|nr:hypothetical protein [Terriglobia bacterium]